MKLFAYLPIECVGRTLIGDYNIGEEYTKDIYRSSDHKCKLGEKYIRCFENFDDVRVYQAYCKTSNNPNYKDGGVIARVRFPKRLLEGRYGPTVYLVENKEEEQFELNMVNEYVLSSSIIREDNIEDSTFDKDCSTPVDELRDMLDMPKPEEKDIFESIEFDFD